LGNDTYVYNYLGADTIREEVGEGTDTLRINAEGNSFGDMYFAGGSLFIESSTDHEQNVLKIENPSELEAITWNWSSANSYTIDGIVSSQAIATGDEQLYVGNKGGDYIQTFASELYVEVYASDGNDEVPCLLLTVVLGCQAAKEQISFMAVVAVIIFEVIIKAIMRVTLHHGTT